MKSYFFIFVLCLFLSSCLISINDIGYKYLSTTDKQVFVPFNKSTFNCEVNNVENLKIQEITVDTLKKYLHKNKYTCVYTWRAFCDGPDCKNLKYYTNIAENQKNKDFKFILLSVDYNLFEIKKRVNASNYSKQIYVIKYDRENYGNNIFKVNQNFVKDLANLDIKTQYHMYYYYKDTTLIHYGVKYNQNTLDSLIEIYDRK